MDHLPPRSIEGIQRQFAGSRKGRTAPANLREWIYPQMWPTPLCRHEKAETAIKRLGEKRAVQVHLSAAVKLFPTPVASRSQSASMKASKKEAERLHPKGQNSLSAQVASEEYPMIEDDYCLNPDWVEWLMSWPVGWTSINKLKSDEILNQSLEPDIPRSIKKQKDSEARLTAIGNGQFSLCVPVAWRLLANVES